jgi:hypothetical protein
MENEICTVVVFNDSFDATDEKNIRDYVKDFQASGRATSVHREHIMLGEIDRLRAELTRVTEHIRAVRV